MLSLWCVAAVALLAQADESAQGPVLPEEVVLRGDRPALYGKVTEVPNGLQIEPDEPWNPKRRSVFVKADDVISRGQESARHHEARYRENFEKLNYALTSKRYWVPQDWVPKAEVEYAKRAQEMTKTLNARLEAAASESAEPSQVSLTPDQEASATPTTSNPAGGPWGPMVFVGVIGLALAGLAAKLLL